MKHCIKGLLFLALILTITSNLYSEEKNFSLIDQLPSDTLVVAHWPDIPKTIEAFQKTSLFQLSQDPEVKMFTDSLYAYVKPQVEGSLQQMHQEFGISLEDALGIFQGEVTLALVNIDLEKKSVAGVLGIEFKEHGETIDKAVSLLKKMLGISFSVETFEGTDVFVVAEAPPEMDVCYAIIENTLVVSSQKNLMVQLISEKKNTLKNSENFNIVQSEVFIEDCVPSKMIYLNIEQALKTFSPMLPPQVMGMANLLGVTNIKSLAIGGSIIAPHVNTRLFLHATDKKGILTLLDTEVASEKNLQKIPDHVIAASIMHTNYENFFSKVEGILQELDPNGGLFEQYLQGSAQLKKMLGFSLKDDLFGALGNEHFSFSYMPEEGGLLPRGITSLELKNVEKFWKVMDQFSKHTELNIEKINVAGITVHCMLPTLGKLGNNPFKGLEKERNPVKAFAKGLGIGLSGMVFFIEDSRLYLAAHMLDMKDFLFARVGWNENISSDPDFINAKKYVPKGSTCFVYSDFRPMFNCLWNTVTPLIRPFDGLLRDMGFPIDSALLPRAKTISKYLTPGTMSYVSNEHGMVLDATGTIEALLPVAVVGTVAIVASIAIPEIERKMRRSREENAASQLKQIATAQSLQRVSTGSYKFLQSLEGINLPTPTDGVIQQGSYYFYCYLSGENAAIGEKDFSAEKKIQGDRFVIYAWPVKYKSGHRSFAINEKLEVIESYSYSSGIWSIPNADAAYSSASKNLQGDFAVNGTGQDGNYWYTKY